MINRLVAENTLKINFKGSPCFTVSSRFIAYYAENYLQIKSLDKDVKDLQVPIASEPKQFLLLSQKQWLLTQNANNVLQIYQYEFMNGLQEGTFKKIAIFSNVQSFSERKGGIVLIASNNTLKTISFREIVENTKQNVNIDTNMLPSITGVNKNEKVKCWQNSSKIVVENKQKNLNEIYDEYQANRYKKTLNIDFIQGTIIEIYNEEYIFSKNENKIDIYNLNQLKLVGKFHIEGTFKQCSIQSNLLLIITNKENTDYFTFVVFNAISNKNTLITHKVTYQKGKGDCYQFVNLLNNQANFILDKKKTGEIGSSPILSINDNSCTLLYILNKSKQKVQIIKLEHSKLMKVPFVEQKLDLIIYPKKVSEQNIKEKQSEQCEMDRARIHSSLQLIVQGKSLEQQQRKFIQNLIDIKIKGVMRKFDQLEKRIDQLQKTMKNISEKIEQNIEKINRQEIKQNIQKLFQNITPKFQNYFSEIFKQVAGVLDQGVTYYNMKLAKEAEFHKEALTQIVAETFNTTEEILSLSKKEQQISEKTQQHLRKLLEAKKKWTESTQSFEMKSKQQSGAKNGEGKVFVKADLNFLPKRET